MFYPTPKYPCHAPTKKLFPFFFSWLLRKKSLQAVGAVFRSQVEDLWNFWLWLEVPRSSRSSGHFRVVRKWKKSLIVLSKAGQNNYSSVWCGREFFSVGRSDHHERKRFFSQRWWELVVSFSFSWSAILMTCTKLSADVGNWHESFCICNEHTRMVYGLKVFSRF